MSWTSRAPRHRLDDGADGLAVKLVDPLRERSQRVDVGRDSELIEVRSLVAQKADVDLPTAEIQSGVQH
jgi:hypothetical protein